MIKTVLIKEVEKIFSTISCGRLPKLNTIYSILPLRIEKRKY
jgi:hypothetical protein